MARAFPSSTFVGSDYHERSIEIARERAHQAGVGDRVSFHVAPAAAYDGTGYDLVTMFDCLHDMVTRSAPPATSTRPLQRTALG
jgi:ubiquinone/menaquinone biosynthesis C-methylase UbiE